MGAHWAPPRAPSPYLLLCLVRRRSVMNLATGVNWPQPTKQKCKACRPVSQKDLQPPLNSSLEKTENQEITYSFIFCERTRWHIVPLISSVGGVGDYPALHLHLHLHLQGTVVVCAVWTLSMNRCTVDEWRAKYNGKSMYEQTQQWKDIPILQNLSFADGLMKVLSRTALLNQDLRKVGLWQLVAGCIISDLKWARCGRVTQTVSLQDDKTRIPTLHQCTNQRGDESSTWYWWPHKWATLED